MILPNMEYKYNEFEEYTECQIHNVYKGLDSCENSASVIVWWDDDNYNSINVCEECLDMLLRDETEKYEY